MALLLKTAAAYLVPGLVGWVLLAAAEGRRPRLTLWEKLPLAVVLGMGAVGFYLFYLGVLGVGFSRPVAAAVLLPTAAVVWALGRRRGWRALWAAAAPFLPPDRSRGRRLLAAAALVLVGVHAAVAADLVAVSPSYFDDSVSFWNMKGKVYFEHRGIVLGRDDPDLLGQANPHYPNGIPLFKAWVAVWAGEWNDKLVNLDALVLYLCLGALFFGVLSRSLPPHLGAVFSYLLMSVPLLAFHAGFAYYDAAVGLYFFAGIAYLVRAAVERDRRLLAVSALAFAAGLSTKDEMVALFGGSAVPVLALVLIAAGIAWRRKLALFLGFLALALLPNLPWFLVKASYNLQLGLSAQARVLEYHSQAFALLELYFFHTGNYNLLWPYFLLAVAVSVPALIRDRAYRLRWPALALFLALAVSLGVFVFTPFFEWLLVGTTINRAMLTVIPLMVYYCALAYWEAARPVPGPQPEPNRKR
ncbi:MAG TPA: hypothetical protein PK636_03835 [bacterium]|nr:hypothetical protein [bacterium]